MAICQLTVDILRVAQITADWTGSEAKLVVASLAMLSLTSNSAIPRMRRFITDLLQ